MNVEVELNIERQALALLRRENAQLRAELGKFRQLRESLATALGMEQIPGGPPVTDMNLIVRAQRLRRDAGLAYVDRLRRIGEEIGTGPETREDRSSEDFSASEGQGAPEIGSAQNRS